MDNWETIIKARHRPQINIINFDDLMQNLIAFYNWNGLIILHISADVSTKWFVFTLFIINDNILWLRYNFRQSKLKIKSPNHMYFFLYLDIQTCI